MTISGIIPALSRASAFDRVLRTANRDADFSVVDGLRVPLLGALLAERTGPQCLFVITATGREAEAVRDAVSCTVPDADVLEFPAWETLPHERLSPSAQTVGTRIATLRKLAAWQAAAPADRRTTIVVASVRAALQPIAGNLTSLAPVVLRTDSRGNDLAAIASQLVDLAYARVDLVTRRGEFAVRGGILDVFPPTADHPVRVDFFGDEIEAIKAFSVADQRTTEDDLGQVELTASRELLLSDDVRQRAREMLHEFPNLSQMLAKVAEGSRSRAWSRSLRPSCRTSCPSRPTCPTPRRSPCSRPSGSARVRTAWRRRTPSSCRLRGPPPSPGHRRRSTSTPATSSPSSS